MRCVAGVGLLVLVGCNRIFGIPETQPWDAPPPVHYARLTWQLATTTTSAATAGAPSTSLAYPVLDPGALQPIRIAPLDGTLAPVDYKSDGRINLPQSYFEGPADGPIRWRLEYQLTPTPTMLAPPPHEIQWQPDDNVGHVVVPIAGRLDRDNLPSNAGYRVTPSNPPAGYTAPRILTTGLWTDGLAVPIGSSVDYDFSGATWLSGEHGRPDPAKGDRAYVVDFMLDPTVLHCRWAVGGAPLASAAVDLGAHTDATVAWETLRQPIASGTVDFFAFIDRLVTGLGKLHGMFISDDSRILFGIAPGTTGDAAFPGLTGSSQAFDLPVPVMQTLLQCRYDTNPLPPTVLPSKLVDFPLILHVQIVDTRKVGTITLPSGLETVLTRSAGTFTIAFPAAMPTAITLATPSAAVPLDLAGDADQLAAGAPTGPFVLAFDTDARVVGLDPPDYYDVLLHKLAGDTLTTERIYTVTIPQVRIDPSVLVGGAEYVFEIRSFKGHPMASHGDFSVVQYPYGSAVVFTRTFKTS